MPILKKIQQHKLLLDTHIWLWVASRNPIISSNFLKLINHDHDHDGILISTISVWEIGVLVEKKRITLDLDCMDWIEIALKSPRITLATFTPRIAVQSTRLPGPIHGDPADRILIATAHEENAVLVTCDKKILAYGKDRFISVYDPTT